jgi:hypothetical protein
MTIRSISHDDSTRITQDRGRHAQHAAQWKAHNSSHCVDLNGRKAFPEYPYHILDFSIQLQFEFVYSQRIDMITVRKVYLG